MTHDYFGGAAVKLPTTPPPMPAVSRILARFDREQVEAFIEVAIAAMDLFDGDADVELNGDEFDYSGGEDDFCLHNVPHGLSGPGCPISDPDKGVDDEGEITRAEDDFCTHSPSGPGCPVADSGIVDTGGLSESHGCDAPIPIRGGGSGDC